MIDKAILGLVAGVAMFSAGFGTAFFWQGVRYDNKLHEAASLASKQKDEAAAAWADNLAAVLGRAGTAEGRASALDRCIRAGRCSPVDRERMLNHCPAPIPATAVADAAKPEPVLAGTGATTNDGTTAVAGLIQDCAVTTAQLNSLQAAIEAQKGY